MNFFLKILIFILVILVIVVLVFIILHFFIKKPNILPINPVNPNPPHCKPIPTNCDPVKFCMKIECDDKVVDCKQTSACLPKFKWDPNIQGFLYNLTTGRQKLSIYILDFHSKVNPAIMTPFRSNLIVPLTIIMKNNNILGSIGTSSKYLIGLNTGDIGNPLLNFVETNFANWYYNEITGQLVDNLENPKIQISLSTVKLSDGNTYQQLFSIPYDIPTSKEIWYFTKN